MKLLHDICIALLTLLITLTVLRTGKSDCTQINHDSNEFRVSPGGYAPESLSHSTCQQLCKENFLYAGLLLGVYCLCSSTISDFTTVSIEKCEKPCLGSPNEICGSDDPEILYVIDIRKHGFVNNITIEISNAESFTDMAVEGTVTVEANTSFKMNLQFGDGTSVSSQKTSFQFSKYYRVPGEYRMRASAVDIALSNSGIFDEAIVKIEDKSVSFEFSCPSVIKPGSEAECCIRFHQGTYLSVTVQMEDDEPKDAVRRTLTTLQFPVPDPFTFSIGRSVQSVLSEEKSNSDFPIGEISLPYINVYGNVYIKGFEFYMKEDGNFDLLIIKHTCPAGEYYSRKNHCDIECSPYNARECERDRTFCSYLNKCIENVSLKTCYSNFSMECESNVVFSLDSMPGYHYYEISPENIICLKLGETIGFKTQRTSSVWYRNATLIEILNHSTGRNGMKFLNDDSYIQAIAIEPLNIKLKRIYNMTGNYSVQIDLHNPWIEIPYTKSAYILVQEPIFNVTLSVVPSNVLLKHTANAEVEVGGGTDISLEWDYGNGTVENEFFPGIVPPDGFLKNIICDSVGNYLISINASNIWSSEVSSEKLSCFAPVTRNWNVFTDSPKMISPGDVTIYLEYGGVGFHKPQEVEVFIYFGDSTEEFSAFSSSAKIDVVSGKWKMSWIHAYSSDDTYNVSINISNSVDFELFEIQIFVHEMMGNLSVASYFTYAGVYPDDRKEMKGPSSDMVPIGSRVYFECKISGYVTMYTMSCQTTNCYENSTEPIFTLEFIEVGDWMLSFIAWNPVEGYSNEMYLRVRALMLISGGKFEANTLELVVAEFAEFDIHLPFYDNISCIIFNGGDGETKLGFGNVSSCLTRYTRQDFKWTNRPSFLSSRIMYQYMYGGTFQANVHIFNFISEEILSLSMVVSDGEYPAPLVWIDRNSTNINAPLEKERGRSFRLETTTYFRVNESYSALHKWCISQVDELGNQMKEIDVSVLRTSNCSAIRIPQRFLEFGMYKFSYTIIVISEDKSSGWKVEEEKYSKEVSNPRGEKYCDISDKNDNSGKINCTILGKSVVFTFVKIIPTPLVPLIIKGGASYIYRGPGQGLPLQPTLYSEDPDYPEEKNFSITWFCKKKNETLLSVGKFQYDTNNPSQPILNHSNLKEDENKGGCFGKGPGLMDVGFGDFFLNIDMLWGHNEVYEIIAVINKSDKVTESHLIIEVAEKKPPSISVRCEKRVACFPQILGQYVNPDSWVSMVAQCHEDCGEAGELKFEWHVFGSDVNKWTKENVLWNNYVIIDRDRIGINTSLFGENPKVNILLIEVEGKLSDPSLPTGRSSIFLLLNKPPTGGNCKINATSGMALIDYFLVEFSGWYDEDDQNITDLSIYAKYGGEILHLQYGLKTKFDIVLPFGELELWCTVEDELGGIIKTSIFNITTSLPTEEQLKEYDNSRIFDKSIAEGRMHMISQIIIAKISIQKEYAKRRNESNNFGNINARDIDRKWEEYLELDGIDSSYFTPQAREEILEELQEDLEKKLERLAEEKTEAIDELLKLPMDSLPDVEVFGGAFSSVSGNGPLNKKGKGKVMHGIKSMHAVMKEIDVSHPEHKTVAFQQLGNTADELAESILDSMIEGNFLRQELKEAERKLDLNVSEPNPFIMYVVGNSKEVRNRISKRTIDAAKADQSDMARNMASEIKEIFSDIQNGALKDIMVNSSPFTIGSKNGFQMTLLKRYADDLSGSEVRQGEASFILPDICTIHGKKDCDLKGVAVGTKFVKWSAPLESFGEGSENLGKHSSAVQLEITDKSGNSVSSINNTREPIIICIPHSSIRIESSMEYVVPQFESDDGILVYHKLTAISTDLSISVQFKPDNSKAPMVIIYKYGNKSALNDYDGIHQLQDIPCNNGVYNLLISSKVIRGEGNDLYIAVGQLANTTDPMLFFRNKDMFNLTVINMTNDFTSNYSIRISTAGCYYFDEKIEKWSTQGCKVVSISNNRTCCACNHLTSFASGFIIAPNEIDFNYVFSHVKFMSNYTIYITLIVTFSLFIIFLIFARWRDRKDIQKLGATPLPDNNPSDKYLFEILVFSGFQRNAGTKSNVFFIVSGEDDETEVRLLSDDKRSILQKGSVDVFVMAIPRPLGQLNYLRLWHDNSGKGKWSSWYVRYIVFRDVQTGQKYEFIINKWFALEEGDGMIDRLIPVAGKEQVTEFSHLFATISQRNFADHHLWFSIFLRPPRSRFTRVQRVSCCMAVLYMSMLTNAMYYQTIPSQSSGDAFKLGPLSLSPEQIAVGIVSNFIVFPPTFLMIFFFRKSRPRKLRPSRIELALKQQYQEWKAKHPQASLESTKQVTNSKNDEEAQVFYKKRKFSMPWWCVTFGWIFVVSSTGISIFFLWAYGIVFGDEKTAKWITSLLIAFISSVFITQPIKVFMMAIFVSCICRSKDYDQDDADEDEEDLQLAHDEEYLHIVSRPSKHVQYRPMDIEALKKARKEREKEVKMHSLLREICAYFFFFWVITILSYRNRDPNSFYIREAIRNSFIKPGHLWIDFNNVNTEKRFWNWTYEALLPELFAGPWYNTRPPLGLRLYLDDRNNLKIGYAVMRQVRIKPRTCEVSWLTRSVTPECAGYGNVIFEDGTIYTKGWKKVDTVNTPVPPEYKYLTASQLKGFPFWGQVDWYGGGGYVVPLLIGRDSDIVNLKKQLKNLEKDGWIDRHTRAVFVEFGTYNAQVNLFVAVTILAEFIPGGGIVPYYHIDPVCLLNYHTGFGLFKVAIEIMFVIFTCFFTVFELMKISKQGIVYFSEYWNIIEVSSILVSYSGIGIYIYKFFITLEVLRIFTETEGTGYVKLQEAVLLDEILCYHIGFIMSVSLLKFLKLLRFNRRIGVLSSTLRKCAEELKGYSVCLMVVFVAFVTLFWLLLGRYVREFSTFLYAFESSISMMLKKFNYEDMQVASPIFTPIAFFTFSLATAVILINILLSIIIRSFEDVKHDTSKQGNEYEIFDFFVNKVKMILGCRKAKVCPLPSMYQDKVKPEDTVSSFPQKVDKLVGFIDTVYFGNQMNINNKELLKHFKISDSSGEDDLNSRRKKKTIPNKALKKNLIPKSIQETFDDI